MTKKPAKGYNANALAGAVRHMALASIGAVALAADELKNLVDKLSERGEIVENDGRKRLMEVIENSQEQMRPAKTKTGDVPKNNGLSSGSLG